MALKQKLETKKKAVSPKASAPKVAAKRTDKQPSKQSLKKMQTGKQVAKTKTKAQKKVKAPTKRARPVETRLPKALVDPARLGDVVEFTMKTRWGVNRGHGRVVKLPYTDDQYQHRLVVRFAEAGEESDGLVCPFPSQCRVVERAASSQEGVK